MKTVFLALFFATALSLVSGCMVSTPYIVYADPEPVPSTPVYVYTYPAGGCWANGLWYAACPWSPGPQYGYYAWYGRAYVYRPGVVWTYHPGHPPPRGWHNHANPPHHRRR